MAITGQDWIEKLNLEKHPEGGYYRETYRCSDLINQDQSLSRYPSQRNVSTAIYYLLMNQEFSAFHQLKSDEIFHFYSGSPLEVHLISDRGQYSCLKLGNNLVENENPQLVIPHGYWFGSRVSEPNSYSLIGCTVAPGFNFADFILGKRQELLNLYPEHQQIITDLTFE